MEENLHTNVCVKRWNISVTYNCTVDQIITVWFEFNLCQNVNTKFISGIYKLTLSRQSMNSQKTEVTTDIKCEEELRLMDLRKSDS